MEGNESSLQTDDVHLSQLVGQSTTARIVPITGARTLVREGRHHTRLTMTKSRLPMTNDHPVPPRLPTDTVQEGTQYPSHTMTNDSPPSPPTSRTPQIRETVSYNDVSTHGIQRRDIGPHDQVTVTHKSFVPQTQSVEDYYKKYIASLMREHAD